MCECACLSVRPCAFSSPSSPRFAVTGSLSPPRASFFFFCRITVHPSPSSSSPALSLSLSISSVPSFLLSVVVPRVRHLISSESLFSPRFVVLHKLAHFSPCRAPPFLPVLTVFFFLISPVFPFFCCCCLLDATYVARSSLFPPFLIPSSPSLTLLPPSVL